MNKYEIVYLKEVLKDVRKLGLNKKQKEKLRYKIEQVSYNPVSKENGGLGEKLKGSLKGLLKFRFDDDYRVVYQLIDDEGVMKIVVIGLRSDKDVYKTASKGK